MALSLALGLLGMAPHLPTSPLMNPNLQVALLAVMLAMQLQKVGTACGLMYLIVSFHIRRHYILFHHQQSTKGVHPQLQAKRLRVHPQHE